LGYGFPVRVQSMTTTDTMDTKATVAQTIRLIEAGCDYVRITAPSLREAENLEPIKKTVRAAGFDTPLIADIHFTPNAALTAARLVEKVRINPGNFADKKKFQLREYSDSEYEAALERIRERFLPLVKVCKEYGTAMRIGTNHGSLSDRIMSRYGDTPEGMVESAMEFVQICEEAGFQQIVLSMKASNPQVMVQAYRLLVNRMMETGRIYPLHLGVTEAGEGEDGRIKSAIGIGTLMEDGLGDTIRVSLTEEPEAEVPVARALVERYENRKNHDPIPAVRHYPINPFSFQRRPSRKVLNIGGGQVPVVMADFSLKPEIRISDLAALGYTYLEEEDKWAVSDSACDYLFTDRQPIDFPLPGSLAVICSHATWLQRKDRPRTHPFLQPDQYLAGVELHPEMNLIYTTLSVLDDKLVQKLKKDPTAVLLIDTYNQHGMAEQRRLFVRLMEAGCDVPVIIGRAYGNLTCDRFILDSATDTGALLIEGLGDGLFLAAENCGSDEFVNQVAFGILQATRMRISRTEYISCPSCGRTLFDLQETTARIRARTSHLKGLKIAIMGCIVNGPGEMVDADYGYVGSGPGRVTLYRGREIVQRNIPSARALDALIDLIRSDGRWVEPT